MRARPRADRAPGSTRSSPALEAELDLRADALDAAFGRARPALETLYLGGGTPSLLEPTHRRAPRPDPQALRARRRCRGHARGQPRPRRARRCRRLGAAGVTRLSIGAQSLDDAAAPAARPAPPVARRRRCGRRGPRGPGSARSASTCCTTCRTRPSRGWMATLDAALALDAGPPLALRPDPRRPRRRGLDRPGWRPPADRRRRASLARDRTPRRRTRTARRRSTTTRSVRLAEAGLRGYEISNWARPGHESRHNLAYWERRPYEAVGPGAHAFDGGDAALERGPARRLPRRAHAARRLCAHSSRRAARSRSIRRPRPPSSSSSACGSTRGIPLAASREPPLAEVVRLGAGGGAARRHDRRAGRPHDPRAPALQRAVRPPGLIPRTQGCPGRRAGTPPPRHFVLTDGPSRPRRR